MCCRRSSAAAFLAPFAASLGAASSAVVSALTDASATVSNALKPDDALFRLEDRRTRSGLRADRSARLICAAVVEGKDDERTGPGAHGFAFGGEGGKANACEREGVRATGA